MKTITCDACSKVLDKKEFRLIARVRYTYDENQSQINCIVHEGMEFCSSGCLNKFVGIKLKELVNEDN